MGIHFSILPAHTIRNLQSPMGMRQKPVLTYNDQLTSKQLFFDLYAISYASVLNKNAAKTGARRRIPENRAQIFAAH